jgi:hypothetical protein
MSTQLTNIISNLQKEPQFKKFDPEKCPHEITFDMLNEEMKPESEYEDTEENRNILWKSYYIVCLSPNPFGFYINELDIDNIDPERKRMFPWYVI